MDLGKVVSIEFQFRHAEWIKSTINVFNLKKGSSWNKNFYNKGIYLRIASGEMCNQQNAHKKYQGL